MIGVIAKEHEVETVREFFQLFKTPWEIYRENRKYEVVIAASEKAPSAGAGLILFYSGGATEFDFDKGLDPKISNERVIRDDLGFSIPIYGRVLTFCKQEKTWLALELSGAPVAIEVGISDQKVVRIGYDLFAEIAVLLVRGQPLEFAQIPAIDRHIAILRKLILNSGQLLLEIPPAPGGHDFIVCLTHDVDFAGIRSHRLDRAFFGFMYRALLGSVVGFLRRRLSLKNLIRNWYAVFMLPGVFMGLVEDFWIQFKRYLDLEESLPSTFFFVPFKNRAGKDENGCPIKFRAVKYDINDFKDEIKVLIDQGCEIGLHGIDAWIDPEQGRREYLAIAEIAGRSDVGVRMHWLYFNENSPRRLAEAGLSYDSTLGFNDAIGFRSGTVQAFGLPGAGELLELPLNIMDTALFYPDRMNFSEAQAWEEVQKVITSMTLHGGALTVNWHQRSIAPERLWDDFYVGLLENLKQRKVWFATTRQAVQWFQQRRAVRFGESAVSDGSVSVELSKPAAGDSPGMVLRVYKPGHEYTDLEIPDQSGNVTLKV